METKPLLIQATGHGSRPHSLGKSVEWKLRAIARRANVKHARVPTRWGNQLNGNLRLQKPIAIRVGSPHSLGKSVEWKRAVASDVGAATAAQVPTRWGNQLNGNPPVVAQPRGAPTACPHSLGKSVEWKQFLLLLAAKTAQTEGPHSLGKSVEWKQWSTGISVRISSHFVPTRWGNQLNGNF